MERLKLGPWAYFVITSNINTEEPKIFYAPGEDAAFVLARMRWPDATEYRLLGTMEKHGSSAQPNPN